MRALEDSTWPHLEDLGFTGVMGRDVADRLPPLRRVHLDVQSFGEYCWLRFKSKQKDSLRVLDVRGCHSFLKWWAPAVFTHFERLEEFSTWSIYVTDIKLYPHALNSLGLKKLEVFFISDPKNPDEDQAAFELLSNFEKLEREHQGFSLEEAQTFRFPHTLRWRLDVGLGQLSKLKSLRRLVLDNRFQDMIWNGCWSSGHCFRI